MQVQGNAKTAPRRKAGMEHISDKPLPDGRWLAKIKEVDADGTVRRDGKGGIIYWRYKHADLDQVKAKRDEYLRARLNGEAAPQATRGKMTVGQWLDHWHRTMVSVEQTATTADNYAWVIRRCITDQLGGIRLSELTLTRLERWKAELLADGIGAPSIDFAIARLKTALTVANHPDRQAETGYRRNVALGLKRINEKTVHEYAGDPSDTRKLYEAAGDSYMAALPIVATDLGLRRSEIVALRWGDVDLDAGTATLRYHTVISGVGANRVARITPGTKASKSEPATLYLSARATAALREARTRLAEYKLASSAWRAGKVSKAMYVPTSTARAGQPYIVPANPVGPEALVFPQKDGDMWDGSTLGYWFSQLCAAAGVTKSLHGMRHDCATFLLGAGVPLPQVSKHMRHAKPDITAKIYAHAIQSQNRMAADTFDLLDQAHAPAAQAV